MNIFLSVAKSFSLTFVGMLLLFYLLGLVWNPDFYHDWGTALTCAAACGTAQAISPYLKARKNK